MLAMALVFIAFAFAGLFLGVLAGDRLVNTKLDGLRLFYESKIKELELRTLILEKVLEKLDVYSSPK